MYCAILGVNPFLVDTKYQFGIKSVSATDQNDDSSSITRVSPVSIALNPSTGSMEYSVPPCIVIRNFSTSSTVDLVLGNIVGKNRKRLWKNNFHPDEDTKILALLCNSILTSCEKCVRLLFFRLSITSAVISTSLAIISRSCWEIPTGIGKDPFAPRNKNSSWQELIRLICYLIMINRMVIANDIGAMTQQDVKNEMHPAKTDKPQQLP